LAKTKSVRTKSRVRDNAVVRYLRETRAELRKVRWPTRQEAWGLTRIVLGVTVVMAAFLGVLDFVFTLGLKGIVEQNAIALGVTAVIVVAGIAATVVLSRRAQ